MENDVKINTSSNRLIIFGMLLFALLFGAGGAWAYFANLSGAVIATGEVVVRGKPKVVQHLDGGIVSEIAVDNGSYVKVGDRLVLIDDTLLSANLEIYTSRIIETAAQRDRLIAERDDQESIAWDNELHESLGIEPSSVIREAQARLMEARRETRNGGVARLREQVTQFMQQISGIQSQIESRIIQLELIDQELEGLRELRRQGLALSNRVLALERQREDIRATLAGSRAEISRIRTAIGETELQILQIGKEFREQVLTELRELERELNELVQQHRATSQRKDRVEVTAPVSGIVHELSIFTIGGVIAPGEPILQIVPDDQGFEIEARIEPQAIDQLFIGQEASIRFPAFNQRTTPDFVAAIRDISPNVVMDQVTGALYYKAWLKAPDEELARLGGLRLIAGMPAEVFIRTGDRSPLSYLVKPLTDQFRRAMTEE